MIAETRVISETGGEKGQKLPRLGGADAGAMLELAEVYGFGEGKYARFNYLKGYPWSLSIDALYRHLLSFQGGEDRDPESGLLHMAHVAWHALALTAFTQRRIGTDDRYRQEQTAAIRLSTWHGGPRCPICFRPPDMEHTPQCSRPALPWGDV